MRRYLQVICKTDSVCVIFYFVLVLNILKGMVNLNDRIQNKLQKIGIDVKKRQQESLVLNTSNTYNTSFFFSYCCVYCMGHQMASKEYIDIIQMF